jgi:Flp pilus assembly protein TadD
MPRRTASPPASLQKVGTRGVVLRAALIVIVGALAYSNSLAGPFISDDESSIVENPAIRSLGTVLLERKNSPIAGRPVAGYSFAVNFLLDGLEVSGYHLVNVAIHIGCALLLFGIVRRTLLMPRLAAHYGGAALSLALAVSLLWVVHPLNTEAVNYITQRTELLMALFYLTTLYAAIRDVAAAGGRGSRVWPTTAVAACALGMGCKESMVTAPLMVLLYDRIFVFNSIRDAVTRRWRLYGSLATTWLVLAYLILPGPRASSAGFAAGVQPWVYLLNQAVIIGRYLRLVFWPADLAVHYGAPVALTLGSIFPQALLIFALLVITIVALLGITIGGLSPKPAAGFLGAWFFVTLAPSSSFIPIATEVGAERRMYLPLMAVIALIVLGTYGAAALRRRLSPAVATWLLIAAVAALSKATFARNMDYQSPLRLAESSLAHWPSDAARGALGSELQRANRDEEAIVELQLAARTDPRSRYNLGVALFNNRRFQEAIDVLATLVSEYPMREEVPWARRLRGNAYIMLNQWANAIVELRLALSMSPHDEKSQTLLAAALNGEGIELGTAGKHAEAAAAFRQALALDPDSASVRHNLATALLDSGDITGALAEAQRNIERHPADAPSYDLAGRALAMQGNVDAALVQLEQARRLKPDDPAIHEDLERVLAARKGR